MERVSKFRGKTGTIWVEGYFVKDYEGTAYITTLDGVDTYVVDEKTVSYFTGLTDKNGKDIYEGDIIEIEGSKKILHVVFKKGCFYSVNNTVGTNYRLGGWEDGSFCIIGNIYENPELLSTDKTKTV